MVFRESDRLLPRRRWIGIGGIMLAVVLSSLGGAEEPAMAEKSADRVVKMVIDYGDGVQKHFTRLEWQPGATVLDMMETAARHPRGIRFQQRGQGATALITRIDDVGNEGGGGSGRNWIYRVNDQLGSRSAGICPVESGDTILWSFETYR